MVVIKVIYDAYSGKPASSVFRKTALFGDLSYFLKVLVACSISECFGLSGLLGAQYRSPIQGNGLLLDKFV